jgi:ribokinase
VATGGLGSGIYLALEGNETVGREESRGAYILDRRDFAKLHVIVHYVKTLLGDELLVVPVGRVGTDSSGGEVRRELQDLAMDLTYVSTDPQFPTLFSVCFAYPSGEGGNLTALNSASAALTPADARSVEPVFERFQHRGIALVAPEVPLDAREALLHLAGSYDFLRVGSFVAGELRNPEARRLLGHLDLLSINAEEAAALADMPPGKEPADIAAAAVDAVQAHNRQLLLVVTAGKAGSWVWDGNALTHDPGIRAKVANSAGAGDAHLAGLVVGLACGLALTDANSFATVLSALKVEAEDTISWEITSTSAVAAAAAHHRALPSQLLDRIGQVPADARERANPRPQHQDVAGS